MAVVFVDGLAFTVDNLVASMFSDLWVYEYRLIRVAWGSPGLIPVGGVCSCMASPAPLALIEIDRDLEAAPSASADEWTALTEAFGALYDAGPTAWWDAYPERLRSVRALLSLGRTI